MSIGDLHGSGGFGVGWKPWATILSELERAKDKHESYKTFWNTTLARLWRNLSDPPPWEILYERKKQFKRGEIPEGALCLTMGVDVQHDRLEALLVGWGRRRYRYVIEHFVFPGDPARPETWAGLETLISQAWPIPLLCTAVDCGDGNTSPHVLEFVAKQSSDRVIAAKGASTYFDWYIQTPRHLDVRLDGKRKRSGVKITFVGTGFIKSQLYSYFRLSRRGKEFPPGWVFFAEGFPPEFYEQATAETLQTRRFGERQKSKWVKIRERNEVLDDFVLATAAAATRGVFVWTEAHWSALEEEKKRGTVLTPTELRRKARPARKNFPGISLD